MANVLLVIMPLDTSITHTVQELKQAGLHDISFVVGGPEPPAGDQFEGVERGPEVSSVMQLLATDATYNVPDLGMVTVSGPAARFSDAQHDNPHDFLVALLGHDEDADTTAAIRQSLADGHALLAFEGDMDAAQRILGNRPLAVYS